MKTPSSLVLTFVLLVLCGVQALAKETLFVGTCRNVTHGVDGYLKLYVVETERGLEGYMSISGHLFGSGPLKGAKDGRQFNFSTTDASGGSITWQGILDGNKLSGEYVCLPDRSLGTEKEVGEWEVAEVHPDKHASAEAALFKQRFLVQSEILLNSPVEQSNGSLVSGAQSLFDAVHPVGGGVSVCVTGTDIEWKVGASQSDECDIHRYVVEYILFRRGVIRPTGWTRLRLTYNAKLSAVTKH